MTDSQDPKLLEKYIQKLLENQDDKSQATTKDDLGITEAGLEEIAREAEKHRHRGLSYAGDYSSRRCSLPRVDD